MMRQILIPLFLIAYGILMIVRARQYAQRRSDWNQRWLGWGYGPATVKQMTVGFVICGAFFTVCGVLALLGVIRFR